MALSNLTAHVYAGHAGHHYVEYYEVYAVVYHFERAEPFLGLQHVVAFMREKYVEHFADILVILDYEDRSVIVFSHIISTLS